MHDKNYQMQLIEKILLYLEGRLSIDELLQLAHYVPTDRKLKKIVTDLNDIHAKTQYGYYYSFSELEEKLTTMLDTLTKRNSESNQLL